MGATCSELPSNISTMAKLNILCMKSIELIIYLQKCDKTSLKSIDNITFLAERNCLPATCPRNVFISCYTTFLTHSVVPNLIQLLLASENTQRPTIIGLIYFKERDIVFLLSLPPLVILFL